MFRKIRDLIGNYFFKRRMAKLMALRAKEPPPPPTQLDEILAFSEQVSELVERFTYRFGDAIDEGVIDANEPVVETITKLKFAAQRIKDELLIKVQKQKR